MNMKTIITSKNITDPSTVELLHKNTKLKKNKTHATSLENTKASTSTSQEVIIPLPLTSVVEINKVTPPTLSLEVPMVPTIPTSSNDMRAPSHCCSTTMAPPLPPQLMWHHHHLQV
jgi:hypothetical protein